MEKTIQRKTILRDSNIEILRLLAMMMVLIVHANGLANGFPSIEEIKLAPMASTTRIMTQSFSIVAVNVFVLISGWFGIRFSFKSFMNIVYQAAFYSMLAIVFCLIYDKDLITAKSLYTEIFGGDGYWFISAYLLLMLLSPVLNKYVETAPRETQKTVIISFLFFQSLCLLDVFDNAHFHNGYSCISFIGLYLIARYVRLFNPSFARNSMSRDLKIYLTACGAMGGAILLSYILSVNSISSTIRGIMLSYSNPICICAALYLLMAFTKIKMGVNNTINWLAKSSFSIYLIHTNILLLPLYTNYMHNLYLRFNGILCIFVVLISLFIISLGSIIIDKIRIFSWNILSKHINYEIKIK